MVKSPASHDVPWGKIEAWLESGGRSPSEQALKVRLEGVAWAVIAISSNERGCVAAESPQQRVQVVRRRSRPRLRSSGC